MIPKGLCQCGCGQRTKISQQNQTVGGYVRGEPRRFLSGHHSRLPQYAYVLRITQHAAAAKPRPSVSETFWSKVQKGDGCWLWMAARDQHGYGCFHKPLTQSRVVRAYRMAWELTYGPVPPGLHVCHHCDNPPCVRPDHLFLGTAYDNMHDAISKGRIRRFPEVWKARLSAAMKGRRPTPEVVAAGKRIARMRALARHEGHDITIRDGKFHCRTCKQRKRRGQAA